VAGDTSTVATGGRVTVTADVPVFPSLVAVISTTPSVTPVTRPFASTVAIKGGVLSHVTVRPGKGLPSTSFGVAVSCNVAPSCTVPEAGSTSTV
jgi:hypothetical protein